MRNAGVEIEILIEYISLLEQEKETVETRKNFFDKKITKGNMIYD